MEVECLPGDIPSSIEADVSELVFGKVLRVDDLPHNRRRSSISTDANQPVAHVTSREGRSGGTPEAVAAEAGAAPPSPK